MKYYLYIIETIDNTLYCGIAKDPINRYKLHSEGLGAKYTKAHKPKELVYLAEFEDKNSALKEEYRIKKTLIRVQKLELIKENKEKTKKLIASLTS